jgi:hypothetical protein
MPIVIEIKDDAVNRRCLADKAEVNACEVGIALEMSLKTLLQPLQFVTGEELSERS